MARAAANQKTDVEAAVRKLREQQLQVTPYRIQKILGGGSYAWIRQTLRELQIQPGDGLPDSIDKDMAKLIRLAQPLVEELAERANKDLDKQVESHDQAMSDLMTQLEKAEVEKQRLASRLRAETRRADVAEAALKRAEESNAAEKTKLEGRLSDLDAERKNETQKHEVTREKLTEAKDTISALEKQLSESEAAAKADRELNAEKLNHYRNSAARQASEVKAIHAEEIKNLNLRIRDLETKESRKTHELGQLNRENAELVTQLANERKNAAELQEQLTALKAKVQEAQSALSTAQTENARLEAKLELRNEDVAQLKADLSALTEPENKEPAKDDSD